MVREALKQHPNRHLRPVAIALDTKGPEIRTGQLADSVRHVVLESGKNVRLTVDEAHQISCSAELIYVNYKKLPSVVEPMSRILIDDGMICLIVEKIGKSRVFGHRERE